MAFLPAEREQLACSYHTVHSGMFGLFFGDVIGSRVYDLGF